MSEDAHWVRVCAGYQMTSNASQESYGWLLEAAQGLHHSAAIPAAGYDHWHWHLFRLTNQNPKNWHHSLSEQDAGHHDHRT